MSHFIDISDFSSEAIKTLISLGIETKANKRKFSSTMNDQNLCLIFQKSSTRTRVSFEIAMSQLGGKTIVLNQGDIHLGKNESIKDTVRVLSRMVNFIMVRCYAHNDILEFAQFSTVPIINGLTDFSHPCQIIASAITITEKLGDIEGKTLAFIGDANNVCTSYMQLAEKLRFNLRISSPAEYKPNKSVFDSCIKNGASIKYFETPSQAVKDSDVVITDTWVSMGDKNGEEKMKAFSQFQVNAQLMSLAKPRALFSHCLPAHRGCEVTDGIIDSPISTVLDEAENRIYAQKAILLLLNGYASS